MRFPRKSGILLHPTSLPGPYGIGEIGPEARRFIARLQEAGQHYWQMLPLGPTGYADSPYQALSSFAGNPVLLSTDDLMEDRLLRGDEAELLRGLSENRVDFGGILPLRGQVMDLVARRFSRRASAELRAEFEAFCEAESAWLEDFALYSALKEAHQLRPWTEWDPDFARRDPAALRRFSRGHASALRRVRLEQFLFRRQWNRLHEYAAAHQVKLIGDLPIFAAQDSADVWANPELFQLDETGNPLVVAGVPPDYFSADGQRWGNPHYRWERHRHSGYAWWFARLEQVLGMVDLVRIDHFRGFEASWEIPANEATAVNGRWQPGPGADFFQALRDSRGDLPLIAEDLGVITPAVDALRDAFDLPGMRILHFSFGGDGQRIDLRPEGFPENCVVYTGTHDNDTSRGWFARQPGTDNSDSAEALEAERQRVLATVRTDGSEIHWDLIRLALETAPHTAIAPLQDVMGLGSEARMNVPGRTGGNWGWRFRWPELRDADVERLRALTAAAGRL